MFSKAGAGWLWGDLLAVDPPEDLAVDTALVTHHHPRHAAGAMRARRAVMNPLEHGMLADPARARRYAQLVYMRAGAPGDPPSPPQLPQAAAVHRFTAGWVDLGEASVRAIPCGAHTWGHTCYAVEAAVFVGDLDAWIVSVDSLLRAISMLRSMAGYTAYPAHGPPRPAAEYAEELSTSLRRLAKAYVECVGERTPYRMALCARGQGPTMRLAEEGLAFAKYLADMGVVRLVAGPPYVVVRQRAR